VTLVYIPRKYNSWCRLPEDFRKFTIKNTNKDIKNSKESYEYDDIELPVAKRDLQLMWKILVEDGFVSETRFGYYNSEDGFYMCHIFQNMITLLTKLGIVMYTHCVGEDNCNCIINLGSEEYLLYLRKVMIKEFFK